MRGKVEGGGGEVRGKVEREVRGEVERDKKDFIMINEGV